MSRRDFRLPLSVSHLKNYRTGNLPNLAHIFSLQLRNVRLTFALPERELGYVFSLLRAGVCLRWCGWNRSLRRFSLPHVHGDQEGESKRRDRPQISRIAVEDRQNDLRYH